MPVNAWWRILKVNVNEFSVPAVCLIGSLLASTVASLTLLAFPRESKTWRTNLQRRADRVFVQPVNDPQIVLLSLRLSRFSVGPNAPLEPNVRLRAAPLLTTFALTRPPGSCSSLPKTPVLPE